MTAETKSGPDNLSPGVEASHAAEDVRVRDLRRQLITKGGLIVGGTVILTIANRPAWAKNSHAASHNLSHAKPHP